MSEKKHTQPTPIYFIFTALFSLVMPNTVFVVLGIIFLLISGMSGMLEVLMLIGFLAMLAGDFCFMYLWGRHMTVKLKTPQTLTWIYFPVLVPLFWQTLTAVIFMVIKNRFGTTEAMVSFDFWGSAVCAMTGLPMMIAHLIPNIVIISGFAIGERVGARKLGTERKGFGKKPAVITGVSVVAVLAVGMAAKWYADLGRADYNADDYFGHGFNYEHGWSSVDLSPYYVENPDNLLVKLSEPSELTITGLENMPSLDGAEAAYPVYSAFAAACYKDIAKIQTDAKAAHEEADYERYSDASFSDMPVRFTNTVRAFEKLVEGDVDIFFGAKPSAAQYEMAQKAGKELVLTPIGKEAFVFFVSEENPIDGLSSEQIRKIYSGEYTRWSDVGGELIPILAFQRPENSGSQTMMEYFMGDTPLKEPVKSEYEATMIGVISSVASYQNKRSSLGYSFRYYANQMSGGTSGIKLLELDGVYPDKESISSGAYPMTTGLYAVTLADNPNENVQPMLDWITGAQGQKIVDETGYVPIS